VPMENHTAEQEEVALISLRKNYVTQRKLTYYQSSETHEELVARFPARHSCQHCKEEIINKIPASHIPAKCGSCYQGCHRWVCFL
jgi:hypothetical protein